MRASEPLVGMRMPSGDGVAGWVLTTRAAARHQRQGQGFALRRATRPERTGFVPQSLMCAPLLHADGVLGVINVLDRPLRPGFALEEIDLLGQFANQAALALLQLQRARRVRRMLEGERDELQAVARLAAALAGHSATAEQVALLDALTAVMRGRGGAASARARCTEVMHGVQSRDAAGTRACSWHGSGEGRLDAAC